MYSSIVQIHCLPKNNPLAAELQRKEYEKQIKSPMFGKQKIKTGNTKAKSREFADIATVKLQALISLSTSCL